MTRNEAVKIIRKKPVPSALEKVYIRTAELFEENSNASQALYKHLKQILPSITFYEALLKITGNKEKSVAFFDKWAHIRIEKMVLCCADCDYMDDCDLWYSKNFI